MDPHTIATAFILTHGNPPRSLYWRPGGFRKNDYPAVRYCNQLEEIIKGMSPTIKRQRLCVWRNKVLRIIFEELGIERKKT